jgi:hypothetical protein
MFSLDQFVRLKMLQAAVPNLEYDMLGELS